MESKGKMFLNIMALLVFSYSQNSSWENSPYNYENSPYNYENSPYNYNNSPYNYKNSPNNYDNSPCNYNNDSNNYKNSPYNPNRRDLIDENGNSKGYYVPRSDGGVNYFNNDGKRKYYSTP